jgi:hypothetical protein
MILIVLVISESLNTIHPGKHIGKELKWLEILRAGKCTRLYPRK